MITYDKIETALIEALGGEQEHSGYSPEELDERLEFIGIEPSEFKEFLFDRVVWMQKQGRLNSSDKLEGYIIGAVDFMMTGVITGKYEGLDSDASELLK